MVRLREIKMQLPYYPSDPHIDVGLETSSCVTSQYDAIPLIETPVCVRDQTVTAYPPRVLFGHGGDPIFDLIYFSGQYILRQLRPVLAPVIAKLTLSVNRSLGPWAGPVSASLLFGARMAKDGEPFHYFTTSVVSSLLNAAIQAFKVFVPYTHRTAKAANLTLPAPIMYFDMQWSILSRVGWSPTNPPEVIYNWGCVESEVQLISNTSSVTPANGTEDLVVRGAIPV